MGLTTADKEIRVLIKELSRRIGVSVRSIRHYEAKGLISAKRRANGYRDYDESAEAKVKTIQLYLSLGLTTDKIGQIIDCPVSPQNDRPLCKEAYRLYQAKLAEVNQQLEILQAVKQRLEAGLREMNF